MRYYKNMKSQQNIQISYIKIAMMTTANTEKSVALGGIISPLEDCFVFVFQAVTSLIFKVWTSSFRD